MCGIAGIMRVWKPEERERALATPPARAIPEAWLDILDDSIRHRGPDGQGRFRDRAVRADGCVVDVAFVHRRLSIIDHAGGHQPMVWEAAGGAATGTPALRAGRLLTRNELEARHASWSAGTHTPADNTSGSESRGTQRVAVVFNGCIYNHRELRAELVRAGRVFSSDHSDTEVLVHGWPEWGHALFARLDGMFALAIWDGSEGNVLIARDLAGQKPCLFAAPSSDGSSFLMFSSCLPGLVRLREVSGLNYGDDDRVGFLKGRIAELEQSGARAGDPVTISERKPHPVLGIPSKQVDLRGAELEWLHRSLDDVQRRGPRGVRIDDWLRFGFSNCPPQAQTFFECAPGGFVSHESHRGGFSHGRYLQPAAAYQHANLPEPHPLSADSTDLLITQSVNAQLVADVPIGLALSGGVDSSLLAAIAQRILAQRGERLRTFTVRMPDARFDESAAAAEVAARLGTDHTTLECASNGAQDLLVLVQQLGLPFGDSSLLPAHWLSVGMRARVGVALGGEGGDELFGGYERHLTVPALRAFRRVQRVLRWLPAISGPPRSRRERLSRFLDAAGGGGYGDLLALFSRSASHRLTGRQASGLDMERFPDRPWLEDLARYLPYDLLRKSDTASMSVALELRSPMLSRELIRCAYRTSAEAVLRGGERKGLLKQVARRYLPAEIVNRPKQGFAIPIGEWFRSDYGGLRTMLLDHLNSTEPFGPPSLGIDLNMAYVKQMLDEHLGTGPSGIVRRDHSQRLYMLLVLSIWAKWLGGMSRAK